MVDEWTARSDRPIEAPLLHLQLSEELERLRQEPTWRTSGRNAITLAKEPACSPLSVPPKIGKEDGHASGVQDR